MAKAVPEGMHTITPQLAIDGCDKAIEWYKKAFGAELLSRAPDPSGQKVWHASLKIGNSIIFVNDVFPEMGGGASTASLWLYTENVDQAWKRATEAGGKVTMPIGDMFWGDRMGQVADPFGNKLEPRPAHEGHDAGRDEEGAGRVRRVHAEEVATAPTASRPGPATSRTSRRQLSCARFRRSRRRDAAPCSPLDRRRRRR